MPENSVSHPSWQIKGNASQAPRIRIDMLLHIGWYKLIGLAFVNIFIALALVYAGIIGPGGIM